MRALLVLSVAITVTSVFGACGGSNKPAEQPVVATASAAPPPPPACNEAPANPGDALTKEPQVMSACLAGAAKPIDGNLCGQAKIAFEIGKDGRVTRAEVASSTLPSGVTDCIKARLSALQYACPKEGTAAYTLPVGLPIGGATGACPGLPAPGPSPAN